MDHNYCAPQGLLCDLAVTKDLSSVCFEQNIHGHSVDECCCECHPDKLSECESTHNTLYNNIIVHNSVRQDVSAVRFQHLDMHSDRKFSCPECSSVDGNESVMQLHMGRVHGIGRRNHQQLSYEISKIKRKLERLQPKIIAYPKLLSELHELQDMYTNERQPVSCRYYKNNTNERHDKNK